MDTLDYGKKSDDELYRLFVERDGLRIDAQRALEAELVRRGITAADHARFQKEEARDQAAWDRRKKQKLYMSPSTRRIVDEGRKTVHWWAIYKRQTGNWPWFSITIHFLNWVAILFGGAFLVWWTVEHHLPRWQFLGMFLLIGLPYAILENWAKRRVKLNLLRDCRRLAGTRPSC